MTRWKSCVGRATYLDSVDKCLPREMVRRRSPSNLGRRPDGGAYLRKSVAGTWKALVLTAYEDEPAGCQQPSPQPPLNRAMAS